MSHLPSAAVPVPKVSVYLNTLYLPPVQTHFAPLNPLKSRWHELVQMSTTKTNCVLKWTLKVFAFELFIGTRSLISLKSPLIHISVGLWPVCVRECVCSVCVFVPDHRIFDGCLPGEIPVSELQSWMRINICTNVSILSMFAGFCTILYILSDSLTIKQGMKFTATTSPFCNWYLHPSTKVPGGRVMRSDGQQGAGGCTVSDSVGAFEKKLH